MEHASFKEKISAYLAKWQRENKKDLTFSQALSFINSLPLADLNLPNFDEFEKQHSILPFTHSLLNTGQSFSTIYLQAFIQHLAKQGRLSFALLSKNPDLEKLLFECFFDNGSMTSYSADYFENNLIFYFANTAMLGHLSYSHAVFDKVAQKNPKADCEMLFFHFLFLYKNRHNIKMMSKSLFPTTDPISVASVFYHCAELSSSPSIVYSCPERFSSFVLAILFEGSQRFQYLYAYAFGIFSFLNENKKENVDTIFATVPKEDIEDVLSLCYYIYLSQTYQGELEISLANKTTYANKMKNLLESKSIDYLDINTFNIERHFLLLALYNAKTTHSFNIAPIELVHYKDTYIDNFLAKFYSFLVSKCFNLDNVFVIKSANDEFHRFAHLLYKSKVAFNTTPFRKSSFVKSLIQLYCEHFPSH